jgi:cell division transport system permease protein
VHGIQELRFNVWNQVMTMAAVTLIVFLGGLFVLCIQNMKVHLLSRQGNIAFTLYWDTQCAQEAIEKQWQEIKELPSVVFFKTYTSDEALKTLAQTLQEHIEITWLKTSNPLPPTATVTVRLNPQEPDKMLHDLKARFQSMEGVQQVHFNPIHARQVSSWIQIIDRCMWPVIVLLAVIIGVIIGNTFKLSQLNKREELEVLRLVGATRWYIQCPFLVGAAIQAIVGACLALVLLKLAKEIVSKLIFGPLIGELEFLSFEQIVCILGVLTGVSLVTSWGALRNVT